MCDTVGLKTSESCKSFQHLVWLMWPSVTPCDRGQGHLPRDRQTARENYIFLSRARNKHTIGTDGIYLTLSKWVSVTKNTLTFSLEMILTFGSVFYLSLHFLGNLYIGPNYPFRHFVTSESTSQSWRFTKSVAGFILPRADVESCEEYGVVVVPALSASQGRLPVAEAVQCVVCMVVDH